MNEIGQGNGQQLAIVVMGKIPRKLVSDPKRTADMMKPEGPYHCSPSTP